MALLPRLATGVLLLLLALAALDGKPAPSALSQLLEKQRSEDQAAAGRIIDGDELIGVSVRDTKDARALLPHKQKLPCSCPYKINNRCAYVCPF